MRAGLLRNRIELQEKLETRDPSGGTTREWVTKRTVWAQILPLRGQERFEAQQVEGRTTMKIRIRWYSPLDSTWRAKKGSRIFNIVSVLNITEGRFTHELHCTETLDEEP